MRAPSILLRRLPVATVPWGRQARASGGGGGGEGSGGDDSEEPDAAAAAVDDGKPLRVERLLANLGYAKRQECATLVKRGRVTLAASGKALRIGEKVRAAEVLLDGEPLDPPSPLTVLLHKPVGYVVTSPDDERVLDPVVYDLLPHRYSRRRPFLSAVGRLDKETSGLLLLTDDGQLLHRIKSPSKRIWKVYVATLDAPLSAKEAAAAARRFASGTLTLEGDRSPLLPAALSVLEGGTTAEVALAEGRYHQVRRMFAALGRKVVSLHRRTVGALTLDGLPEGEWRHVTPTDLELVFGGQDLMPADDNSSNGVGEVRAAKGSGGGGGGRGSAAKAAGERGASEQQRRSRIDAGQFFQDDVEDEEEEDEAGAEGVLEEEEAVGERRYRGSERWRRRRAAMRREVGAVLRPGGGQ